MWEFIYENIKINYVRLIYYMQCHRGKGIYKMITLY